MSCTETIKHFYEFIDNEVDKSNYLTIKRHIEHCKDCRQRYEFEKGIRAMIKAHCINVTAPKLLHNKILNGLNSIDLENIKQTSEKVIPIPKLKRKLFSARSYAIAASILLLIGGGIFYYTGYVVNTDSSSIVDNVVKNHVNAVNNNLVFNENTSVVGNVNKYFDNNSNRFNKISPQVSLERVRVVGGVPVNLCGTTSPCVIFDKGGNKLSLQIVRAGNFKIKNLERTQIGPKEFYLGNCRGFNSILWVDDGVTYCLTSDINKNDMLNFATTLISR
jgi:mycothiol system anti-sigma-R factor